MNLEKWRRYKIHVTAFLLVFILTAVFGAPKLAHYMIRTKISETADRFAARTGYRVMIDSLNFPTASRLTVQSLVLIGDSSHTSGYKELLRLERVTLDFYLWGFLTGNYIRALQMDSVHIVSTRSLAGQNNWLQFWQSWRGQNIPADTNAKPQVNLIERWVTAYLDKKLPSIEIRHASWIHLEERTVWKKRKPVSEWGESLRLDEMHISLKESLFRDAEFDLTGTVYRGKQKNGVTISGTMDHQDHALYVKSFFDSDFRIPFLENWTDAVIALKGVEFKIHSIEGYGNQNTLKAKLDIQNLDIVSESLSDEKLKDINVGFDLHITADPDSIIIHPETRVYLNTIHAFFSGVAKPFRKFPVWDVTMRMPPTTMDDFLSSIPKPIIRRLDGMRVKGQFDYQARFRLDLAQIDSIRFDPALHISSDFKVETYGDSIHVYALRDTFLYHFKTEMEKDSMVWVGPLNAYYMPYDSIPPLVMQAVIACEDNSFFKNDGFNVLQIERSMRDNIREKKFARGASTISMQLVKNIFLSREKTISRKFQEMMITWLMNHDLALDSLKKNKEKHKKRLMEIYLNIVEWGPDVHGIAHAAEFYFKKKPKELTVPEAVFLATILPNPKKYERYFESGKSKKKHQDFMNLIVRMLEDKKVIDSVAMQAAIPVTFTVRGSAQRWIKDYALHDSTDSDMEFSLPTIRE
ncbi:MAG TPA: biosynthetic peptidoglycan transglycosylase [bacterium]|nr:biosynthetic peptidoglycan transglycosylase [bacterium]HND76402.1 biosynthetic peptidoglycan transglycosylase [bacterium]HNE83386.1 biosynthetic peptidoglycan transglycosylase [bacterium]HNF85003.1 biosynthetic peptidoglycan transglycosylase [bacterium]HNH30178.1 biosynthetic peptidoglycan transglycosylase [bacterium]